MTRLWVAGVAMRGDGYPNAVNTVRLLQRDGQRDVRDHADWLPPEVRLWHLAKGPVLQRFKLVVRLMVGGLVQAVRLRMRFRRGDIAYLPYPAPLTLWWLSMLPARWRPYCVADAYISLWDSMFRDRGGGDTGSMLSRSVRFFEGRALRAARLVLVDTEENRRQMVEDFGLSAHRVRSLPLAIDESRLGSPVAVTRAGGHAVRVLFVGTLVPLHGVDVVLAAATALATFPGIEIRLIGDGQQGGLVEEFISKGVPANFTWLREWQSMDDIAREIAEADICLGVFGGLAKASRVLPFKLYYALAAGKAIVTQADYALPLGRPTFPAMFVPTEEKVVAVKALVEAIVRLAGDAEARSALGSAAGDYYERHLSARILQQEWRGIVERVEPQHTE